MSSIPTISLLFLWACINSFSSGSIVDFRSSSSSIKPLVSNNLTVRCAFKDNSSVPGSLQAVVGKRDKFFIDPPRPVKYSSESNQNKTDSTINRSVNSTPDNIKQITSIVISRDGIDLARLTADSPANAVGVAGRYHVTGQLGKRTSSYLELVWPKPALEDAGNFKCEMGIDTEDGQHLDFSETLVVWEGEVTLNDLVVHLNDQQAEKQKLLAVVDELNRTIGELKRENGRLKQSNDEIIHTIDKLKQMETASKQQIDQTNITIQSLLPHTIDDLKQENIKLNNTIRHLEQVEAVTNQMVNGMNITIQSLKQTNSATNIEIALLKSENNKLKQRLVPDVFFFASYTGSPTLSHNQVLVYNTVPVNEGGAYNSTSGVFLCPIAGFYHFEINAATWGDYTVSLDLTKNGNYVTSVYTIGVNGYSREMATNSAIVKLVPGDEMKVVNFGTSVLNGVHSSAQANTFTGRLIALA